MLSTQELVSTIKDFYAPEWDREDIVNFIKRAQERLCLIDCPDMVFWNGEDPVFPVPFLQTTAGQLEYEISSSTLLDSNGDPIDLEITREGVAYPVNARRIRDVFVLRSTTSIAFRSLRNNFYNYSLWDPRYLYSVFRSIECIPTDMQGSTNATIKFLRDPGTTTDCYYVAFYHTPIELLSDTIPLTIDGPKWQQALIDGAVGYIEDIENGKSERLRKFDTYWVKKFSGYQNENTKLYRPSRMKIRSAG